MLSKRSRPAIFAVALSALLLSSSVAGLAIAGSSSTVDVQQDESIDGDKVIEDFVDRIETLETVQFTRTTETVYNGNTTSSTERVVADLNDFQSRTEVLNTSRSVGGNLTTVMNESKVVSYNPKYDSVSEVEVTSQQLLPQIEAFANDSLVEYEYIGTESIDGESTHVLEATPQRIQDSEVETELTVYVDTETNFPVKTVSEVVGSEASFETTLTYENVVINEEIPDSEFELEIPEDATQPDLDFSPEISQYDSYDALDSNATVSIPSAELADGYSFEGATVIAEDDYYSVFLSYSDGEDSVSISTRASTNEALDRSESDRYDTIEIGDTTGYLYSDEDFVALHWEDNQSYSLYGEITDEEATGIAESIQN